MRIQTSFIAISVALGVASLSMADAADARTRRTRTPTPTPAPAPAPALSATLSEQVFQRAGSTTSLRTQTGPATYGYDAASQTYTVREFDGTTFSFSPGEIVAAESSAAYTVYRNSSGVTFRLLNKGAANPLVALSYVTYGTWGRGIAPTTGYTEARKQDWLIFGPKTAAADIPRVGTATYSAILDGSYHDATASYALSGTAGLTADFARGALGMFINPVATNNGTGAVTALGGYRGAGAIDYSAGTFRGSDSNANYNFNFAGSFYGPAANEVAGDFYLYRAPGIGGGTGSGIFIGAQGALPAQSAEPVPPPPPPATGPASLSIERIATATGAQTSSPAGATIAFDSASGTYVIRERDGTSFSFAGDEKVLGESTAAMSVFRDTASATTLRHLNASDPSVALTYVTYGSWRRPTTANGAPAEKVIHVVYGSPTLVSAVPTTGAATYRASLDGTLTSASGLHALGGTAQFNADFAMRKVGYTLRPVATVGGQAVAFADMSGSATISGAAFAGRSSTTIPALSSVAGGFFGPTAEEVGGTFSFSTSTYYGAPVSGSGAGIFVGKRD